MNTSNVTNYKHKDFVVLIGVSVATLQDGAEKTFQKLIKIP